MPRPGAVTRSMTRADAVALLSTPEQVSSQCVEAGLTVEQAATSIHDSTVYNSMTPELSVSDSSFSSTVVSAEFLTQNRMTILRLEQDGVLTPGILTIESSGELRADLTVEPDRGTMVGLFPNMVPSPDIDEQIPSWIRDYLIKTLNVHGHGPPAVCRAFYDHLREGQEDFGINNSVRTAESHLAYATISLRHAVEEIKNFVNMQHVFKDTYDEEVWNIIKTVKRLVGYEGEEMPKDIRMLVEIAEMGTTMKEALDEPLKSLIINPYNRLLDQLELVSKGLRMELDRIDRETEKAAEGGGAGGPRPTPDSGIGGCSNY